MIDKKETLIPQLKIEKISGLPEEDSACGIFSKRIALADGRLGIMTVCILINDGENSDLQTILKDIFELSTKKMEGSSNGILDAVKLAAGAAKDYLADQNLDINFAFAFFYKDICYFAKFGQKVKILVFDQAEKVEITYHDGSGPVKKGQIYLLATDEFLSIIDDNILRSGQEHDIEETIDGLATEISNKSNQGQNNNSHGIKDNGINGIIKGQGNKGSSRKFPVPAYNHNSQYYNRKAFPKQCCRRICRRILQHAHIVCNP